MPRELGSDDKVDRVVDLFCGAEGEVNFFSSENKKGQEGRITTKLSDEVGKIIHDINQEGISIILVEQNARMALNIAHYCYVLEVGKVTMEGIGKDLVNNEDVQKAYLGG